MKDITNLYNKNKRESNALFIGLLFLAIYKFGYALGVAICNLFN